MQRVIRVPIGPPSGEVRYFRSLKAARHYQNRYPDAKIVHLRFVNGGWVNVS